MHFFDLKTSVLLILKMVWIQPLAFNLVEVVWVLRVLVELVRVVAVWVVAFATGLSVGLLVSSILTAELLGAFVNLI